MVGERQPGGVPGGARQAVAGNNRLTGGIAVGAGKKASSKVYASWGRHAPAVLLQAISSPRRRTRSAFW